MKCRRLGAVLVRQTVYDRLTEVKCEQKGIRSPEYGCGRSTLRKARGLRCEHPEDIHSNYIRVKKSIDPSQSMIPSQKNPAAAKTMIRAPRCHSSIKKAATIAALIVPMLRAIPA
jgi:hypothetical protein